MVLAVNQELCTGCGVCMEVCSFGAIQLVEQRAVIDDALCTQCEVCVDACSKGAITAIFEPAQLMPTESLPAAETQMIPAPTHTAMPVAVSSARRLAPLAGATLAFLGREVAPRLANVLVTALEHRLTRQATNATTSLSASSNHPVLTSRGIRRQARYHGGRSGN